MSKPDPTPPTHDPGMISSPAPSHPSEEDMDPITSQWQRLASMERQSPDFLPLLLSLVRGTDRSSTMKLRGDDAKATLGALDEISTSAVSSTGILKGYAYHHQYHPSVSKKSTVQHLSHQRNARSSLPC